MSSTDFAAYMESLVVSPHLKEQIKESMKNSQLAFIQDSRTTYTDYTDLFDLSQIQNIWTFKGEDFLAIPWSLTSSSSTGYTGNEVLSWKGSSVAIIDSIQEEGLGAATANFYQENQVNVFRNIELGNQYAESAANSSLELIGWNLDDANPGMTGGYALGQNSALVDRQEFLLATSSFTGGVWSGIDYIPMKMVSNCRQKMGIRKFGSRLQIGFSGNGQKAYFPLNIQNAPTGSSPVFSIGNVAQPQVQYWYRALKFSDEMEKGILEAQQDAMEYTTYAIATQSLLNNGGQDQIVTGANTTINVGQGLTLPTKVVLYGNPAGSNATASQVSPFITSLRCRQLFLKINGEYTYKTPLNNLFTQYNEFADTLAFAADNYNGPVYSYQSWVVNPVFQTNAKRFMLNMDNPFTPANLTLELVRTDTSGNVDGFCACYFTTALKFTDQGTAYTVDKSANYLA